MIPRTPEPEVMDDASEAVEYDTMDHSGVNAAFVADFLQFHGHQLLGSVLDIGTGTALIPLELVGQRDRVQVDACDRSVAMLGVATKNILRRQKTASIKLIAADSRQLPFPDDCFDAVISNSLIHHLPIANSESNPIVRTAIEMSRVLSPGGTLFVRDLCRPKSADSVEDLVSLYTVGETAIAKQLFRQSLHAALTVEEVRLVFDEIPNVSGLAVEMTSDRHWTVAARAARSNVTDR